MRLNPPDSLDSDELADWARHPATKALADAIRDRWRAERLKSVKPEDLQRLQGQHEVIDALEEWFAFARR